MAQRWLVDDGGSPCPDAEDNSLAGLVVKGDPYPDRPLLPAGPSGLPLSVGTAASLRFPADARW